MEKMICSSCGATLIPSNTQAFLVCEYCDTSVPNPHYDEAAAKAAAEPTLEEICVETLIQMGENENLASLGDCFGNPLKNIDSSRAALNVPRRRQGLSALPQHHPADLLQGGAGAD